MGKIKVILVLEEKDCLLCLLLAAEPGLSLLPWSHSVGWGDDKNSFMKIKAWQHWPLYAAAPTHYMALDSA